MAPLVLATQVATGLGVVAGAMLVKAAAEGRLLPPMSGRGSPRCPTCKGTGRVDCFCSRWSDGDVGCRTCAGSGRMACNSCGGSGTGRPIPARISVRSDRPPL
ncbi:uncharacterized protein LOC110114691 [Dendrobium catenatum]|uniref:Uncharacterized protein n=2 Tax=Dendrobium TaxID=37818 RepID=A0A2I0WU02_9ASPA|nr:uncharacterized protein LOC110114691 [Dendrobium catenatum]KAH0466528.1 hypothetical protein IEQ34_003766 [Dendrobium chrysotoxum]PKU79149.1 hypothetical protein MA16_Dca000493 [Dendrobium catenatum]